VQVTTLKRRRLPAISEAVWDILCLSIVEILSAGDLTVLGKHVIEASPINSNGWPIRQSGEEWPLQSSSLLPQCVQGGGGKKNV
jgi:hypothetical protein